MKKILLSIFILLIGYGPAFANHDKSKESYKLLQQARVALTDSNSELAKQLSVSARTLIKQEYLERDDIQWDQKSNLRESFAALQDIENNIDNYPLTAKSILEGTAYVMETFIQSVPDLNSNKALNLLERVLWDLVSQSYDSAIGKATQALNILNEKLLHEELSEKQKLELRGAIDSITNGIGNIDDEGTKYPLTAKTAFEGAQFDIVDYVSLN